VHKKPIKLINVKPCARKQPGFGVLFHNYMFEIMRRMLSRRLTMAVATLLAVVCAHEDVR
jgi:hypothetical protein